MIRSHRFLVEADSKVEALETAIESISNKIDKPFKITFGPIYISSYGKYIIDIDYEE